MESRAGTTLGIIVVVALIVLWAIVAALGVWGVLWILGEVSSGPAWLRWVVALLAGPSLAFAILGGLGRILAIVVGVPIGASLCAAAGTGKKP